MNVPKRSGVKYCMVKDQRKIWAVFYFALAMGAVFLLAGGIATVIQAPVTFINEQGEQNSLLSAFLMKALRFQDWIFYFYIGLFILLLINIFLSKKGRKLFFVLILVVAVVFWLLYGVFPKPELIPEPNQGSITITPELVVNENPETTPEVLETFGEAPRTSEWLVTVVGIGLALVLASGIGFIFWILSRRLPSSGLPEILSQEAQTALDALEAGADYQDVIIRCYAEMSRLLQVKRGLERQRAMTPAEFERSLIRIGFPQEPVQILTRLFEEVRYGRNRPNEGRQEMAVASLTAIVEYVKTLEENY